MKNQNPTPTLLDGMTDAKKARVMKYFNALKELHKTLSYTDHVRMSHFISSHSLSSLFIKVLIDGSIVSTNGKTGKRAKFEWKSIEPTLQMAIALVGKISMLNHDYYSKSKESLEEQAASENEPKSGVDLSSDREEQKAISYHVADLHSTYMKTQGVDFYDLPEALQRKINKWNLQCERYSKKPQNKVLRSIRVQSSKIKEEIKEFIACVSNDPSLKNKGLKVCKNPSCRVEFRPNTTSQKYCTVVCREFYYQNKQKTSESSKVESIYNTDHQELKEAEIQPIVSKNAPRVCKNTDCSKEFTGRRHKKYCSEKCRTQFNNEQNYIKRKQKNSDNVDKPVAPPVMDEQSIEQQPSFKIKLFWGLISYERK